MQIADGQTAPRTWAVCGGTSGCGTPGWVETRWRPVRAGRSGRGPVDEARARWAQILPEALQSGLQSDSPWGFIRGRSSVHTTLVPKKFVFRVTSA